METTEKQMKRFGGRKKGGSETAWVGPGKGFESTSGVDSRNKKMGARKKIKQKKENAASY